MLARRESQDAFLGRLLISCVTSVLASSAGAATTWYVDDTAPPGGSGLTWGEALTSLQPALGSAIAGDAIEVAQGTYKPTTAGDRAVSFLMKTGVVVRGGYRGAFAGGGDPDERNPALYPSALSGDIGSASSSDNSFHVVQFIETGPGAKLDGFTVLAGNATGAAAADQLGGGVRVFNGAGTLVGCIVRNNAASSGGCGIYGENAALTASEVVVTNHSGGVAGAGVRLANSSATFEGCEFSGNVITLTVQGGGAIASDGGTLKMIDSVFSSNGAPEGGAVRVMGGEAHSIRSCTFANNSAGKRGGAIATAAPLTIADCVFQSNLLSGTSGGSAGGAVAVLPASGPLAAPALRAANCVFRANTANVGGTPSAAGGAVSCEGTASLASCRFLGNSSRNGGGVASVNGGSLRVDSCEFSGNVASMRGGGASADNASLYLTNCTFSRNSATLAGGGVAMIAGPVVTRIENSILWLNSVGASTSYAAQLFDGAPGTPFVAYSTIQGAAPSVGIEVSALDPFFASPLGRDGIAGTLDDDLTLLAGSAAIDAGSNAAVAADLADADADGDLSEFLPLDAGGLARFADDPFLTDAGCGFDAIVDRGAHERPGGGVAPVRGDATGDGLVDGADLAIILSEWGPCGPCASVDVLHNGWIDASDLLTLLGELWTLVAPGA